MSSVHRQRYLIIKSFGLIALLNFDGADGELSGNFKPMAEAEVWNSTLALKELGCMSWNKSVIFPVLWFPKQEAGTRITLVWADSWWDGHILNSTQCCLHHTQKYLSYPAARRHPCVHRHLHLKFIGQIWLNITIGAGSLAHTGDTGPKLWTDQVVTQEWHHRSSIGSGMPALIDLAEPTWFSDQYVRPGGTIFKNLHFAMKLTQSSWASLFLKA